MPIHSDFPIYAGDRRTSVATVVIADGAATSGVVNASWAATGLVKCPAGVAGPLTFTASPTIDGTFTAVNAVSLTITAATEWEEIPAAVMKAGFFKIVNGAGSVTGDQSVVLLLKN